MNQVEKYTPLIKIRQIGLYVETLFDNSDFWNLSKYGRYLSLLTDISK